MSRGGVTGVLVILMIVCVLVGGYFLFLDHKAGITANLKYLFFSEEDLAKEGIFLPSTTYWRCRFSGKDSKKLFIKIFNSNFKRSNIDEISRYLEKIWMNRNSPFKNSLIYSFEYDIRDRPVLSPFWRINITFDDGVFIVSSIQQHFELLP